MSDANDSSDVVGMFSNFDFDLASQCCSDDDCDCRPCSCGICCFIPQTTPSPPPMAMAKDDIPCHVTAPTASANFGSMNNANRPPPINNDDDSSEQHYQEMYWIVDLHIVTDASKLRLPYICKNDGQRTETRGLLMKAYTESKVPAILAFLCAFCYTFSRSYELVQQNDRDHYYAFVFGLVMNGLLSVLYVESIRHTAIYHCFDLLYQSTLTQTTFDQPIDYDGDVCRWHEVYLKHYDAVYCYLMILAAHCAMIAEKFVYKFKDSQEVDGLKLIVSSVSAAIILCICFAPPLLTHHGFYRVLPLIAWMLMTLDIIMIVNYSSVLWIVICVFYGLSLFFRAFPIVSSHMEISHFIWMMMIVPILTYASCTFA